MKRIFIILSVLFVSIFAFGQKRGESILKDGIRIIPCNSGYLQPFKGYNGKIGFVSNCSEYTVNIEPIYDDIYMEDYTVSIMAVVKLNGKYGAISTSLEYDNIPCIYDSMTPFKDGKSKVSKNGKIYLINLNGEKIE